MSDKNREKLNPKLIFQAYINKQRRSREEVAQGVSIMNALPDLGVQFDGLCYIQHVPGSQCATGMGKHDNQLELNSYFSKDLSR